ncbi:unnamed protein product [Gongylonema pulchrum]|uniref:MADS-box domain-containing protein n=1 Tax=Gongylonema pulchrum TaxID=637853 RepID=A0A183EBQ0_9BILA|nr:unnamed protein product [Gongylonema pulchrum]
MFHSSLPEQVADCYAAREYGNLKSMILEKQENLVLLESNYDERNNTMKKVLEPMEGVIRDIFLSSVGSGPVVVSTNEKQFDNGKRKRQRDGSSESVPTRRRLDVKKVLRERFYEKGYELVMLCKDIVHFSSRRAGATSRRVTRLRRSHNLEESEQRSRARKLRKNARRNLKRQKWLTHYDDDNIGCICAAVDTVMILFVF